MMLPRLPIRHPRRAVPLLPALVAPVALSAALACADRARIAGPDVDLLTLEPGTFKARAGGSLNGELTGSAGFTLEQSAFGGLVCTMHLSSATAPVDVDLWIGSELRPRLRDYEVGADPVPFDRFSGTVVVLHDSTAARYVATGGTLHVTGNAATEVDAEFTLHAADELNRADTLTVKGAFRARPDSGAAGICRDPTPPPT